MSERAAEIVEAIGTDAAQALFKVKGGMTVEIPTRAHGSQLAQIVGEEACEALMAYYGAGRLFIPMGASRGRAARRAKGLQMIAAGASNDDIAQACDVGARTVTMWRAQTRAGKGAQGADPSQLSLPFEE